MEVLKQDDSTIESKVLPTRQKKSYERFLGSACNYYQYFFKISKSKLPQ